jgi:hypothetical protein
MGKDIAKWFEDYEICLGKDMEIEIHVSAYDINGKLHPHSTWHIPTIRLV